MTIWWPQVQAQIVAVLPTLEGWSDVSVYSGEPVTTDATDALVTVGFVEDESADGHFEKVPDSVDGMTGEVGSVRSELVLFTGNEDVPGLQVRAFSLLEALETYLLQNPGLEVLPASSTAFLAADAIPGGLQSGQELRLPWVITYFTRS